ncbi:hypothetical protein V8G54_022813 [Vigna mungo]|uniref:Piwi domain-containing protein n=1 Tax=Vigna mungo TaxID=3915 RepID=A0AAQ3N3C1_VIGMU
MWIKKVELSDVAGVDLVGGLFVVGIEIRPVPRYNCFEDYSFHQSLLVSTWDGIMYHLKCWEMVKYLLMQQWTTEGRGFVVDADVSKEVALFVVLLVEHLGVSKSQLEADGSGMCSRGLKEYAPDSKSLVVDKAYQRLGEDDVPKFTVIVAQKNHHTRLFQTNSPENVPPAITHPRNYDFYMCAHAGMMGTSRPVHYHVLLDEIGFSADGLQNLIHSLSYVYAFYLLFIC